jgi:Mce-associated membrane protein
MEGDAGASRLNPIGPGKREEPPAEGPPQGVDAPTSEEVLTDTEKSEKPGPEKSEEPETTVPEAQADDTDPELALSAAGASPGNPSRLGRGWLVGICAALLVLTAGVATGGYFALRADSDSRQMAREETIALQAAKDCVGATQAPDTAAMSAAQRKIIDCSTGDFAVQANLYSGVLVEAYQAANVQVKVSDLRAAVERYNDDGSVQVLVALRVKVTNSQAADQEQGYRLRVQMAPADGTFKIAKLDQVSSS